VLLVPCVIARTAEAKTWHVKAGGNHTGNGSQNGPFSSLLEVESVSQPGDTIIVLPSKGVLDGGIQLKDGQQLIGQGGPVTRDNPQSAQATLTNTSNARYDGDVIRLAKHNVVRNLHIDNAYRSSIFGINADGAEIRDNLMTNDMAVHDLFDIEGPAPSTCRVASGSRVCTGEWPNGYIIYAPQTNHFGAITLVSCGPDARVEPRNDLLLQTRDYCTFLVPGSGKVTAPVDVEIRGNVIRDSNSDGIMLINDTGVTANFIVTDNSVVDLSQILPDPAAVGSTDHVVRSRGITTITIDHSVSNLTLKNFVGSNLSPFGSFAAGGIVFLACGVRPLMNNAVSDVEISNPLLTGDTTNGDSIEIQHRGSTNGVLNVDITRAVLSDPASTNIKLIEAANPDFGVYNVTVSDSVLSNINTAGNEDAQIRYNGTERTATMAVWLTLRHVQISGLGRGIGLTVPAISAPATVNANNVRSFRISVEDSSLADLTGEAVHWSQGALAQLGSAADPPIIDLGGGPLGSHGGNRFVNNGDPAYVPPGASPADIDPHTFDGDISVANANMSNPSIRVYASGNYWGGGAPAVSSTGGLTTDVFIPAGSNVTFTSTSFLTADPTP
jgi:hypothetical protein